MHLSLLLSLTRENSSIVPHAFKAQKYHFGGTVLMDDDFLEKPLCVQLGRCLSVKKLCATDDKTTYSTTFLKHFLQRPKTGQCDAW